MYGKLPSLVGGEGLLSQEKGTNCCLDSKDILCHNPIWTKREIDKSLVEQARLLSKKKVKIIINNDKIIHF